MYSPICRDTPETLSPYEPEGDYDDIADLRLTRMGSGRDKKASRISGDQTCRLQDGLAVGELALIPSFICCLHNIYKLAESL